MRRITLLSAVVAMFLMIAGADGCSSDPNVEGAKLDLRNKDYDRALENLETAIAANPDNAEALKLKGDVLMEKAFTTSDMAMHKDMIEEMVESYDRAAAVNPEMAAEVGRQKAVAYFREFERGIQAFNRGRDDATEFDGAAASFGIASMIHPDSSGAYVNQAFALINASRPNDAIAPFEMALEKGDTDSQTYIFLADLYRTNDRAGDAVTVLETAREMYPDNADIQAQLINAYQQSDQLDRALAIYSEAVNNDPENKLYRYNYGSILLQLDRFDDAIEQLAAAVAIDADYANAQYNLGASYVNKAVSVAEKINELDDQRREMSAGSERDAIDQQIEAMAETRRGNFAMAIPPLEKAKSLTEMEEGDIEGICQALFSAYVQTNQSELAQGVSSCAGYDDMN